MTLRFWIEQLEGGRCFQLRRRRRRAGQEWGDEVVSLGCPLRGEEETITHENVVCSKPSGECLREKGKEGSILFLSFNYVIIVGENNHLPSSLDKKTPSSALSLSQ